MCRLVGSCADSAGIALQGRGFLTGSITKLEDIPEQQRSFNPRMAEENFYKVCSLCFNGPQKALTPSRFPHGWF